jgi:hypothetical protein
VTTTHPHRFRAALLLAVLCFWLVGCELEETLTLNADGSGTYTARILIDKQFAEALGDIKSKATSEGYRIVEESETPDRKVLVISKDFQNVSELSDRSDSYSLRIEQPSKWKRAYALDVATRSSAANGVQKRTLTIVFPMAVKSSTGGTVSGHEVRWDATTGGTLHVEAAGFLLPFGLTPIRAGFALAVLASALLVFLRSRRGPQACAACGNVSDATSRFCGSCGAKLVRARIVSPGVAALVVGAVVVFGLVVTNIPRLSALFDRITTKKVTDASAVPTPSAPETVVTDTTAYTASAVATDTVATNATSTTLPQGLFQGTVVALDVLQLDGGLRVELSGNQDGGCPFYGADHNGEVAWDIRVGDRLEIDGNVFRFTDDNRWSMTPKAPFGVMANRITILSRK